MLFSFFFLVSKEVTQGQNRACHNKLLHEKDIKTSKNNKHIFIRTPPMSHVTHAKSIPWHIPFVHCTTSSTRYIQRIFIFTSRNRSSPPYHRLPRSYQHVKIPHSISICQYLVSSSSWRIFYIYIYIPFTHSQKTPSLHRWFDALTLFFFVCYWGIHLFQVFSLMYVSAMIWSETRKKNALRQTFSISMSLKKSNHLK